VFTLELGSERENGGQEAIIFSSRSFSHSFLTRSNSWLGPRGEFLVLTGSPGCPGQFRFLNQYEVILVKKKKINGLQPGF